MNKSPDANLLRPDHQNRIEIVKSLPFFGVHLACLAAFLTGASWKAVFLCVGLYVIRMFGITAGYHRYFSHRTYKTSRFFQFVLAWIGCSAVQKGPLWWASHHRRHHQHSDQEEDIHSPERMGFWWSHVGWILCRKYEATDYGVIKDLAIYPELRWLNRFHVVPGVVLAVACFLLLGWQGLVWGFFISTVLLYHGTFVINSLCHMFGRRRYATTDTSRNSFLLAFITLGEGWHNNHHYYATSVNQGFFWWELDVSYYTLKLLSLPRIVWDLKKPPRRVLEEARAQAA
ncbi:MAG: acyl-CoA desaturase [Acidobacteriota bacterium]